MSTARPRRRPPRTARLFNRLVLPLAGTRLLPLYGVLEHRGRRSGKLFRTPVVARPTGDGFVVPMPWGEATDWCRNLRAAGECVMRWNGRDYPLVEPRVVNADQAGSAFGGLQRRMMRRLGIRQFMLLRHRQRSA